MPASVKGRSNAGASWGISWMDVADALRAYSAQYHCVFRFTLEYAAVGRKSDHYAWFVACVAESPRRVSGDPQGWGYSQVGGNRGAASHTGATLQAMMQAVDDLEDRRAKPIRAQETARLPGFE